MVLIMKIEQKIDFFKNAIKNSFCVDIRGHIVLYNQYETSNNKNQIYFDDCTADDYACSIDLTKIKDIDLNNGIFIITFDNYEKLTVKIAVIQKYNWNDF